MQSSWVADAVIPHFVPMILVIYIAVWHPHRHHGSLASVLRANPSLGNFGAEDEGFSFQINRRQALLLPEVVRKSQDG